jgi:hypothetical protein
MLSMYLLVIQSIFKEVFSHANILLTLQKWAGFNCLSEKEEKYKNIMDLKQLYRII